MQHKRKSREERQKLQLKVKLFSNENRKPKRNVQSLEQVSDDKESESDNSELDISKEVLSNVSPSSKIRTLRKMKLSNSGKSPVQKALRLHRITVSESGRKSVLGKKVEEFFCQDENSAVVPDKKKASKALRYRLSSLKVLHEKFLAEEDRDCAYSQFTCLVPEIDLAISNATEKSDAELSSI